MAGNRFSVSTGPVATSTTPKSVLQIKAATNVGVLLRRLTLTGTTAANSTDPPAKVRLTRTASGGAFGTFTPITPTKDEPALAETIQATAGHTATVEPTTSTTGTNRQWQVSPLSGAIMIFEPPLRIPGGASLNVEITAGSGTPQFDTEAVCEE